MCGRFAVFRDPAFVTKILNREVPLDFERLWHELYPNYNLAPSQEALVIREQNGKREPAKMKWGLVPFFVKELKSQKVKPINAKSEEVDKKPMFRAAFRRRRCLVPADGFYEWKPEQKGKQPYFIRMKDGEPFAFAGLWERWELQDHPSLETFTILTTQPNALIEPIHNRMPVILPQSACDEWLNPENQDPTQLKPLLQPFDAACMEAHPVDKRVNNPKNNDAVCLESRIKKN